MEEQQQRQGAGVFVAEEDISYFVFSCLWQEICKNLTQEPRKLPVVVAVVVPPPFHAFVWGTTESVHYKTEEQFQASPFPLNMRRKNFTDGGYAELTPARSNGVLRFQEAQDKNQPSSPSFQCAWHTAVAT
ncbi:hypothetical protein QOT17_025156 [Balamuthia mandrillaris]